MITKIRILLVMMTLIPSVALADFSSPTYAYVKADYFGVYYFKMIPKNPGNFDTTQGSGVLYKVNPKGIDKPLWTTEGWYSFSVFISTDGQYLVRMGNWPEGESPSKKDLAIAFYRNGNLLKMYNTRDLIREINAVEKSESHYQIIKNVSGFGAGPSTRFKLITVDNFEYEFDITNGNIVKQKNQKFNKND